MTRFKAPADHALALELAMYQRAIEPVCPLGLTGTDDRWHAERKTLADARQAADLAINEGVNYFDAIGALHGAQLKAA